MVVPSLTGHLDRHEQAKQGCHRAGNYRIQLAITLQSLCQGRDTKPDPDTEGIERTCIRIVSFTRLVGCLVQIEHNGQACHKEQEECNPETLDTLLSGISLEQQAQNTQQQGQHIIDVMSFIIDNIVRHILLRADQYLVDKRNTGDPVTVQHFAISLDIVLTAGEVPHEVAPVHKVQLVGEEITQVFRKRRFHHALDLAAIVVLHRLAFHLRPFLIGLDMARITAEHTREEHIQLVYIFIILIATGNVVTVFLVLVFLDYAAPGRFAFRRNGDAIASLVLTLYFGNVGLSVDKRCLTVLFTRQVSTQREDVARCVLVHRRVGCRTDQCQCIRRITDNDYHQANQDRIQRLDINLFAPEQIKAQGCRQNNSQHIPATDKRNTDQYDRQDKGNLHPCRMNLIAHRFPDRPDQDTGHYNHISEYSGIIRHT